MIYRFQVILVPSLLCTDNCMSIVSGHADTNSSAELTILDPEGIRSMAYPASCSSGSPVILMCETTSIDLSQPLRVQFRAYMEGKVEPQQLVSYLCRCSQVYSDRLCEDRQKTSKDNSK